MRFSTLRQSATRIVTTAVVLAFASIGIASPAHAAGTIQVSEDGIVFGTTYSGTLFDGIANIVPGDNQSEVFHLRNTGPDDGYLRLTLRNVSGDPALLNGLAVSASVPAQSGPSVRLDKASPCWVLNEGLFLAAGDRVTVTAQLIFDASSGNPTKSSSADFDIVASLTDAAITLAADECGGSGSTVPGTTPASGALPNTGGEVPVMLVVVTAFIVGAGLFLVVAARRRRRE